MVLQLTMYLRRSRLGSTIEAVANTVQVAREEPTKVRLIGITRVAYTDRVVSVSLAYCIATYVHDDIAWLATQTDYSLHHFKRRDFCENISKVKE